MKKRDLGLKENQQEHRKTPGDKRKGCTPQRSMILSKSIMHINSLEKYYNNLSLA